MKKLFIQFSVMVLLFAATWGGLSQINYVSIFKLEETGKVNEARLGRLMLDLFKENHSEISNDSATYILNKMKKRLAQANHLHLDSINIHLVEADEVNAFALPGNHLVIHTGLIGFCENPEQLTGVVAHEIAHIQHNHIMKKMIKEAGIAVLVSATGGHAGTILKKLTEHVSSSAYDRSLESEADEVATQYLAKADVDPEKFADLLYRFATELQSYPSAMYWISSHPESKERAGEILKYKKARNFKAREVITPQEWQTLKNLSVAD